MDKKKYVAYVGTYTDGTSASEGIHLYHAYIEEGTLDFWKVVKVNNCSHLALSKNGKYLYSIADEGVEVFEIQPDGDLKPINQVDIKGMRGTHLATDHSGKHLFVGGYHDGKVTMVHTHSDGRLGHVEDGIFHKGTGSVAERNFRPHVCCVRPTPDNKYLCAVDNGIDQVIVYRIDSEQNKLRKAEIVRMRRESGPRVVQFSKDGKHMYVLCQLENSIVAYNYTDTPKGPVFEKIQEITTLSNNDKEDEYDAACAMVFSPDGHYLFCSTAGDDTLSMYKVEDETGLLEKKFVLPISGEFPKSVVPFPDGRHIAVANNSSNSITTFTVDYERSLMIMKGKPQKVEEPNCILFKEIEG